MSTIKVGVAGLGYWGPNLARNFAGIAGCELAWLCDEDAAALERTPPAERPPLYGDGRAGERVAAALARRMAA